MERLCDLLFEFSNEDRLNILYLVREDQLKLSHIANKLNSTVQETSRNVSRLNDIGLVIRDSEGLYKISPLGKYSLELLPGYEFLSKHPDYIHTHTFDRLPHEFLTRIGDLNACTYTGDAMITFYTAERMMQEAEEYLLFVTEQHMISAIPHLMNALKRGVTIRSIMPSNLDYPDGYFEQPVVKEAGPVFMESRQSGLLEERWLPVVDTPLGVSEQMTGRVFFPMNDGTFDYNGFTVVDERSHKFVEDLFMYYWEKASSKIPESYLEPSPNR